MKTQRTISFCSLLLLTFTFLQAQVAKDIKSVIVTGKDSAWYAEQAKLWEKEVAENPQSERAWYNLFEANRYLKFWFQAYEVPRDSADFIINRMERAIPNTFTYHYCRYQLQQAAYSPHAEKALDCIPKEPEPGIVDGLLGYLWRSGKADGQGQRRELFDQLLQKQYEKGYYPNFALHYSYNQLEALPQNSIYIGYGDLDLFPKIMMQRVLDIHQDKVVAVSSFLSIAAYADSLCQRLGIAPYRPEGMEKEIIMGDTAYETGFIEYLAQATKRPVYLEPSLGKLYKNLGEKLYREGLLLKYSPKPYDNVSASKTAIEHKYKFEYLGMPKFHHEVYWKGSEMQQVNYIVLLGSFIKTYRAEGNKTRAEWLKKILQTSVENTRLPQETKNTYLKHLNQYDQ